MTWQTFAGKAKRRRQNTAKAERTKKEHNMLKISLRENKIGNAKSKFIFHSENDGDVTYEEMVKKMASYNTTITEADVTAVMNVFKDVMVEYLCDGKTVRTPLGIFYVVASGTADDPLSSFETSAQSNDHNLRLRFKTSTQISKSVLENTKVERASSRLKMIPYIHSVSNIDGTKGCAAAPGEIIRITGDYMKFDSADPAQGIFLVKDGEASRLSCYIWNKDKRIDVLIPNLSGHFFLQFSREEACHLN